MNLVSSTLDIDVPQLNSISVIGENGFTDAVTKINSNNLSEVNVVQYLGHEAKQKCFHSVFNSNKAILMQTLSLFRVKLI